MPETTHEGGGVDAYPDQVMDGPGVAPKGPLDDIVNGLKAQFSATLELGKTMDKVVAQQRKIWEALQRNTPIYYQVQAAAVAATGLPTLLNLGSPDQGTYWEVSQIYIGGTDYNVTAAGTAGLYIAGNTLARGAINIEDFAPNLPSIATYSHDQIVVNDLEFLFAIVDGGTNLQTYAAKADVTVHNVAAGGGRTVTEQ